MWLDRKVYDDLRLDAAKNNTECRVLSEQNRALQVTQDWLRVRVNQLEMERAQMLFQYLGVKISTPSIEVKPAEPVNPLAALPHFDDLGDEESLRLGISHNADGTLKYAVR